MMYFLDYYWKDGQPYGIGTKDPLLGFNIVKDPYRKRISIEYFTQGKFSSLIYDSNLFDFRKLKPEAQIAWQKEFIKEEEGKVHYLIKDQEDRTILFEVSHFVEGVCRLTECYYPTQILLCRQKLFYKNLGDTFNGVLLEDTKKKPILLKEYDLNLETEEFQNVVKEVWNFENYPVEEKAL